MKKLALIVVILVVAALLFALVPFPWAGAVGDAPLIHHASVQPTKVRPGDTMTVTAEVSDPSGIRSVTANMGGIETVSLSLIEGSIEYGTWQGQWLVHDTKARDYVTTIVATNYLGKSSATDIVWRDPQTYERYYKKDYSELTTDNTSWQDAMSITFTPNVSGDFLVLSRADLGNSSLDTYTEAQIIYTYDETTEVINTIQFYLKETAAYGSFGCAEAFSLNSATEYTFKIQYRTGDALYTAKIKLFNLNIIAVSDYHHIHGSDNSTTLQTFQTSANLTFTPATEGQYLVLATMEMAGTGDSTNNSFQTRLYYNSTTDWGTISREPTSASQYHFYIIYRMQTLSATSHTFEIQIQSEVGSETAYIRRPCITAIRLSDLGDASYSESESENITAEVTYQVKGTLNFDNATYENTLRCAFSMLAGSSTAKYTYGTIFEDGSAIGETSMKPNDATDYVPIWTAFHRYFDNTAHTLSTRWKTQSPADAYSKNARLLLIRMDTLTPFSDSGHATYCNNFNSASLDTVYVQGCYFATSDNFTVAYYDNTTGKVASDSAIQSDVNGVVNSQFYFPNNPSAAPGT